MVTIEKQISVFKDPEEEISQKGENVQRKGNHEGKKRKMDDDLGYLINKL